MVELTNKMDKSQWEKLNYIQHFDKETKPNRMSCMSLQGVYYSLLEMTSISGRIIASPGVK